MPRRAATVTQADTARTMRAMLQVGLKIVRVVTRPDGISIETDAVAGDHQVVEITPASPDHSKPSIVL